MNSMDDFTSVIALGGLGEVGKNMYVFTHKDEIFIIDAGVIFPESDLLGVDYVIQDVTYLKQNESKIKGLLITHGHEDHIGGISFLLQSVNIPVIYGARTSIDLIKNKLEDRSINYKNLEVIDSDTRIKTKHFDIEFIATTHSIPDSFGIVLHTPNGTIVSTGDFKFDLTPIGPMADLHKMARVGSEGVKLLLSDSTNALSEGFSKSEDIVDEALSDIVNGYNGRIIIATFASNIYRVKHIVETCQKNNRKIIVFGRSMETTTQLAINNGLIKDKSIFIDSNAAKSLKKNEICILCTGSQGEPLAALSRIAQGTHKQISLMPDDLVVFSSNPIPGNAAGINRIINKLYLKGESYPTNKEINNMSIKTAYKSLVDSLYTDGDSHCEYMIYDMDQDGTTELIYMKGTCMADLKTYYYTYNDGRVEKLAEMGRETLYRTETEFGLYGHWAHMDYEYLIHLIKVENVIDYRYIFQRNDIKSVEQHSPPDDKYLLEKYQYNDYTGIERLAISN